MTKLIELVDRYRQGPYPVFAAGPFLYIASLCAKNLRFARVLTGAEEMAEAALLNLNLGFESTLVPFDMNVEAELIGCRVNYHEEVDGVPVYPTVGDRWIETSDDFHLPANLIEIGRMPAITAAMKTIKQKAGRRAALGAFIPGPFTLAGQVLDPDRMFVSVLKKPDSIRDVLAKLAELIARVRRVYGVTGTSLII